MDLDGSISLPPLGNATRTNATVLCFNCGVPIDGTTSAGATCYDCLKLTVDLSRDIQREAILNYCRDCDRWLLPPTTWLVAAPESRELLALCLKKLKGLQKVRVIDASFIWTEVHSRRVKVKITVQDSVADGVLLQQSFDVTYTVSYTQCPECAKSFTHHHWQACVQVRQSTPQYHRTFHYLEQLILKHGAHRNTINIKEAKYGIDFYFAQRNQAEAFVNFLESVIPVDVQKSQQLISEDVQNSKKVYKFTYSARIVPICKDDLIALPLKLARQIGNITPLVLCHRIGTSINLLDPNTLQTAEVTSKVFWRTPFAALAEAKDMVEFIVLDIEPTGQSKKKWILGDVTVARASDLGSNDTTYFARTHLYGLLHPGDSVLGYMLTGANFNNAEFSDIESSNTYASTVPDVVLVRKYYPNRRKNRRRNWKLKTLSKADDAQLLKTEKDRKDYDYEMFLRDVEEDPELRAALTLYKNPKKSDEMSTTGTDATGSEGDGPGINMDELIEDLSDLDIQDEMEEG